MSPTSFPGAERRTECLVPLSRYADPAGAVTSRKYGPGAVTPAIVKVPSAAVVASKAVPATFTVELATPVTTGEALVPVMATTLPVMLAVVPVVDSRVKAAELVPPAITFTPATDPGL